MLRNRYEETRENGEFKMEFKNKESPMKDQTVLNFWSWDQSWVKQTDAKPIAIENLPEELSVVTFNVWFDEELKKERAQGLFDLIKTKDPDVICLQEV
jgi:hypothetical protein